MYAFDLLHLDGYDTCHLPLRYRKELQRKALDLRDPVRFTEQYETEGDAYYRKACSKHWEGIVGKNSESVHSLTTWAAAPKTGAATYST